jgi:ABC-type Mn2+/Zn2+ transport system ATPase subunit
MLRSACESSAHCAQVSLAVALLHKPQLLILDEPTVWGWSCVSECHAVQVGVDALLRAKLWEYLLRLVKVEDVTILITTHYIEEARQVSTVGAGCACHACAGGHCGADAGRASACGECSGRTDGTVQQSDAGGCVP